MRKKINFWLLIFFFMLFSLNASNLYKVEKNSGVITSNHSVLLQTTTNDNNTNTGTNNNNGTTNNGTTNNGTNTDTDNNDGTDDDNDLNTDDDGTLTDTDTDTDTTDDDNDNTMSNVLYGGAGLLLGGVIMYIVLVGGRSRDHR